MSLGYGIHINSQQEELCVRLKIGIESYFSLLVGCKIEKREGSVPKEILELRDHLTLYLRACTYLRNHCIVAQALIIMAAMVIQIVMLLVISFSSNHLASRSHSLLLVLLLNRLDILILLLYLLMNITLIVLGTASHDLFRDSGSLNEVSL